MERETDSVETIPIPLGAISLAAATTLTIIAAGYASDYPALIDSASTQSGLVSPTYVSLLLFATVAGIGVLVMASYLWHVFETLTRPPVSA